LILGIWYPFSIIQIWALIQPLSNPSFVMHSQLLEGFKCESKWKTAEEGGVGARSLAHNTLRGRGACWSSEMGLRRIDKLTHSHGPTHNPQKVVSASWSTFGARTSHGQHGHTRLTTAQTWRKPPPSPL
jgi:hypothetical protein